MTKTKLLIGLFVSVFFSGFAAYNAVNYFLINPDNPTRLPSGIASTWINGMHFLTVLFLLIAIFISFLLIKQRNNENHKEQAKNT